jgi:GT2 family glycosyltransferase/glycosyltransferase involved in cell wall biosynthesis
MRILLIVHGLPPAQSGGTETYTFALARALATQPDVEVGILCREGNTSLPELHVRQEDRQGIRVWFVNNTYQACSTFEETYRNPRLCQTVLPDIDTFDPDLVHVHHLTGLSTELMSALHARQIPIVMTLHDYWPLCHRGQLLNIRGEQCDRYRSDGSGGCEACISAGVLAPPAAWALARALRASATPLRRLPAFVNRALRLPSNATAALAAARAQHMREMLGCAAVLLAPSSTLRTRYLAFGIDDARLIPWELGITPVARPPMARDQRPGPLSVLFLGSMMESKAPGLILDAVGRLPPGSITVEFLGNPASYHGDDSYTSALSARLGHAAVRRFGPAPHDRIAAAFTRADVVIVPSVWIENSPLVIKEAFAHGVPVITARLGGMAELVQDGVNGLLFTPGDAASLAEALERLLNQPALLQTLRSRTSSPPTIQQDVARLQSLYRIHARPRPSTKGTRLAPLLLSTQRWNVATVVLNYRTPDETFVAARSIETSHYRAGLIVVDNGGADAESLRALLPSAEVMRTPANLGYSGGCNVGIRRGLEVGADAVLVFNSDAVLHPCALDLLVEALRARPSAGIAAPVLCAMDEPEVLTSAGISYATSTGRMKNQMFRRHRARLGVAAVRTVDAASGCALLISRAVFERCGLLDETYFFSFEDVEFCLRARAAGFETICVSAATAYHRGSTTIGARSARRVYYGVRNQLRLAQHAAPAPLLPRLARSAAIVGYNAGYVARSRDVPFLSGAAALSRGCIDYLRGRDGA